MDVINISSIYLSLYLYLELKQIRNELVLSVKAETRKMLVFNGQSHDVFMKFNR